MRDVQPTPASPACETATPRPAPVAPEWVAWLESRRSHVDQAIASHLKSLKEKPGAPGRVLEAVEYSLGEGGKRARPILVLESCRICGGDEAAAMPAAIAIECVHTFSLIHDDLPAMDDDDLRRGRPANHRVFGEAVAVLAGDWLVAHAFELLAANPPSPQIVSDVVAALARGTQDMIVGQDADIAGEGQAADKSLVEFIHRHKTARLIETCCRLGALAASAPSSDIERLARYGSHLGLAFQIADDLLDRTGTTAVLGKRAGKDHEVSKQTYPAAFGLEASRKRAAAEVEAALAALEPFGTLAERLCGLARFVITRDR